MDLSRVLKPFAELTGEEVYRILHLRSEVFVVEQDCVYQDIDFVDLKSQHLLYFDGETLAACLRVFRENDKMAVLGRFLVKENHRGKGVAHRLIEDGIQVIKDLYNPEVIEISAQQYLYDFYHSHGFKQTSEMYLEDGIPHIKMELTL